MKSFWTTTMLEIPLDIYDIESLTKQTLIQDPSRNFDGVFLWKHITAFTADNYFSEVVL